MEHQKTCSILHRVIITMVLLAPSHAIMAYSDGLLIYGSAGQAYMKGSQKIPPGGYGEAGWGIQYGNHRFSITSAGHRAQKFKVREGSPAIDSLDTLSIGLKEEYIWNGFSIGASIQGGRMTTTRSEEKWRHAFHSASFELGVLFFDNDYISFFGKCGIFAIRPEKEWRQTYWDDHLEGTYIALGLDLAEAKKDF